jgi:beta-1,3-galactosyltransferase 1
MTIYITFYDNQLSKLSFFKFQQNLLYKINRTTLSPHDYFTVRLNLTSNTAICQPNDNLILYILSTAQNFQRRKIIRSTWGSPLVGTCFVFILAKIDGSTLTQLLIEKEKRQYKDIVQIDHNETYQNVVYKEVGALKWASHFYPSIPYLFKTDDDLIVDSILISSIAQFLTTNSQNDSSYILKHRPTLLQELSSYDRPTLFRGGWSTDQQQTLRSGKFGVSESVWSESLLPLYCSGFGWLMSKNVRDKLINVSHTYPLNKTAWVGDVFLSGFLAKEAKIKCKGLAIDFDQTPSGKCACFMAQRPMLTVCSSTLHSEGGRNETAKFSEYEKAWEVIQQRHSSDNMSITDTKACL